MSGKIERTFAIDTSVLIHHANDDSIFGEKATKVLNNITSGKQRGLISAVVLAEFLSLRPRGRLTKQRQERALQRLLGWLLGIPNLEIVDIDSSVAIEAARLRQQYGFKTPDALNLASAVIAGADVFVTSDKKLQKCKEIKVKLL